MNGDKISELDDLVKTSTDAGEHARLRIATQEASSAFAAAVTSEIKRITHEVQENSSKLEKQLTEALH